MYNQINYNMVRNFEYVELAKYIKYILSVNFVGWYDNELKTHYDKHKYDVRSTTIDDYYEQSLDNLNKFLNSEGDFVVEVREARFRTGQANFEFNLRYMKETEVGRLWYRTLGFRIILNNSGLISKIRFTTYNGDRTRIS